MYSDEARLLFKILLVGFDRKKKKTVTDIIGDEYDFVSISNRLVAMSYLTEHKDDLAMVMVNLDSSVSLPSVDLDLSSSEDEVSEDIDGLLFVKNAKEKELTKLLPIVVATDHPSNAQMHMAYDAGVSDYLDLLEEQSITGKRLTNIIHVYMQSRLKAIYQAETDPLTGTLNLQGLRRRFNDFISQDLNSKYLIVYTDIRHFKYFNSAYGFEDGNELLRCLCDTINKYSIPNTTLISRVSGDQIVVVIREVKPHTVRGEFDNILNDVRERFKDDYGEFAINLVAGTYLYDPSHKPSETFDQVVGYARQTQKLLKNEAESGIAEYDDKMWKMEMRKLEINGHLDVALANNEVMVYLQPQYNSATNELIGAECLCRWQHSTLGFLSPGEFIPLLEESGRIYDLDRFIWEEACKLMRKWLDHGKKLSLSINVSRKDLEKHDVPEILYALVKKYELPPEMLRVEITESAYMKEAGRILELIKKLSALGFSVEIDDFGSGFSSLNLLHEADVDVLKLDMGFLKESEHNSRSGSIINAIVKMAHVLDIRVLAEGVETAEQAEFLKNIGCLMAQGYYYSKPIPVKDFEKLFKHSPISEFGTTLNKFQLFNIQELFDRKSSGFFIFNNCMGAAALFDFDGTHLQPVIINDEFVNLIEHPREKLEENRTDILTIFSAHTRERIMSLLNVAGKNGSAQGEVYSERMHKNMYITLKHISTSDGIIMYFMEATDITKEKRLKSKVAQLQKELNAHLEYMPSGTFRCEATEEAPIVYASLSLIKMLGYESADEFHSKVKRYENLLPDEDRAKNHDLIHDQIKNEQITKSEHRVIKADGSYLWVFETGRVVPDENGKNWAYIVFSDIDSLKQEQLNKKAYEKKLHAVLEIPGVVLYEYDPEKDYMTVSARLEDGTISERSADHYLANLRERKWIHEDYIPIFRETLLKACESPSLQNVVAKAIFPGGKYYYCQYHFSSVADENGKVYRVIGRAEKREDIDDDSDDLKDMPVGTFRYEADGEHKFDRISNSLVKMLGFNNEQEFRDKYNNNFFDFVYSEDLKRVQNEIEVQTVTGTTDFVEYRVLAADNRLKWLYDKGSLIVDEYGKRWFYVAVTDLDDYKKKQLQRQAEQERATAELKHSASTDTMTGLNNHNHSLELVQKTLDNGTEGMFMIIDIDDFKLINDKLGHIYGDKAICEFADKLKHLFRENDIIGRFGGDEFICLIPGASGKGLAEAKAKKVIEAAATIKTYEKHHMSVSIGVVPDILVTTDAIELVKMSDKALYSVKRSGKGSFACYENE